MHTQGLLSEDEFQAAKSVAIEHWRKRQTPPAEGSHPAAHSTSFGAPAELDEPEATHSLASPTADPKSSAPPFEHAEARPDDQPAKHAGPRRLQHRDKLIMSLGPHQLDLLKEIALDSGCTETGTLSCITPDRRSRASGSHKKFNYNDFKKLQSAGLVVRDDKTRTWRLTEEGWAISGVPRLS